MANGSSGRPQIGNFSSTIFEHDSSNLMDVFFWNLTGDRTVLHSLLRNCALFSNRKAREFSAGKRCLQRIRTSVRDSNEQVGAIDLNRRQALQPTRSPYKSTSQLPV